VQDYCEDNPPISLKLGAMIGPTNRKNRLTFGGDPVSDTDSGSRLHFTHRYGIWNFRRFISISHTVTSRFSRHSAKYIVMYTVLSSLDACGCLGVAAAAAAAAGVFVCHA